MDILQDIGNWLHRVTLDSTISIEGGVAALALVAAALGYLANLVGNFRRRREDQRIYGDKLVLLELLEAEPLRGRTAATLLQRFQAPSGAALAKQMKATAAP